MMRNNRKPWGYSICSPPSCGSAAATALPSDSFLTSLFRSDEAGLSVSGSATAIFGADVVLILPTLLDETARPGRVSLCPVSVDCSAVRAATEPCVSTCRRCLARPCKREEDSQLGSGLGEYAWLRRSRTDIQQQRWDRD